MKKFPSNKRTTSDPPDPIATKNSVKQALEEQSNHVMLCRPLQHGRSPTQVSQHATILPSQESYAAVSFPRSIPHSYYRQEENLWLAPDLSHAIAAQQQAMMVDRLQTYPDRTRLQQQDPRRELQDLLELEAMLASRHERQARLALARLFDRRLDHADLHHEIGRPRMFPTSLRRHEESGLRFLHSDTVLNHSGARVGVNNVISPQPQTSPQSLATRFGANTGVTDAISESGSRDPPSTPSSPSSEGDEATRDAVASSCQGRIYVDSLQDLDILCGRGGKSNHHTGNKKYRHVVGYMKMRYQHCPGKTQKTDLSRQIVDYCTSYGARFLKQDLENGKYYILSKDEARRKTSQALREPKMLKWTTT